MPNIQHLRSALSDARADADRAERTRTDAGRAQAQAHRDAIDHDAAAQDARLFGRIPTRESRRQERLAAECRTAMGHHQAEEVAAAPAANDAHAAVRAAERNLERALAEEVQQETQDLDRDQWREAMAVNRVRDAVESDEISEQEAYADDGLVRPEVHDREVRKLESDDGLDWDPWSAPADDGYAQAAAEARDDQLTVKDPDLSIDAGARTHEEVYTDAGEIRPHLLWGSELEANTESAPERDEAPQRDRERSAPGFEFDEPF